MTQKIGILTVHKNTNYGANLQAFALCNYINSLGYDCETVDYTSPEDLKFTHLLSWLKLSWDNEKSTSISRRIKLAIALTLSAPEKHKRLFAFRYFWKNYYKLSPFCKDIGDVKKQGYDTLVSGSDQVWNPDITDGLQELFFCRVDGVKKRISYAPSIGKDIYNEKDAQKAKKWINELDYCSLREATSAEYISELTGIKAECVCDPVFLPELSCYEQIATKKLTDKKYVLVYSIVANAKMVESAKVFAAEKGLELIEICQTKNRKSTHKQYTSLGPDKFLSAIKHAEYVFTNSFHGTAFSLIFKKELFAFENRERGTRITNILEKASLINRLVNEDGILPEGKCDYANNTQLTSYIENSKAFLKYALEAEYNNIAGTSCVGCGACKAVCPSGAISLHPDIEGFLCANIDNSKCVDCGMCYKACSALNETQKTEAIETIAFKANDELRKKSASGGAFAALAKGILENGGVCYGAVQNEDFSVSHIRCDSLDALEKIQGTKYVQSDMSMCFENIKYDLSDGKNVLFSGTPCQVASLKTYVKAKKINDENLYLCDIICHGVPSPSVFKGFIKWIENYYKSNVKSYEFRSKKISWRGNSCYVTLSDGRELKNDRFASAFMNVYYSGRITRESCYECKYTSLQRVSDLTISDFWGLENALPEFEDALGISMVMVNTEKGQNLFDKTEGQKLRADISAAKQPQLHKPCDKPSDRERSKKIYSEQGVYPLIKKYGGIAKPSLKSRIYHLIKK